MRIKLCRASSRIIMCWNMAKARRISNWLQPEQGMAGDSLRRE
jgi:hypothetical protein